jgi:hypothetical protein
MLDPTSDTHYYLNVHLQDINVYGKQEAKNFT